MSQTKNTAEVIDYQSERPMAVPVFLFVLAILYDISPIDIIPDIPVVGYVDDFFITAIATLNLLQKWLQNSSVILASMQMDYYIHRHHCRFACWNGYLGIVKIFIG